MHWVDEIVEEIIKTFNKEITEGTQLRIRDEKTLSGPVHVGSLRGIVLHGLIGQVLSQKGVNNVFKFELNDTDPMDGLPVFLDEEKFKPHMGKPLFTVPPIHKGEENFTSDFGLKMQEAVEPMHIPIEYYHLRPLYEQGLFNEVIVAALENAETIRRIYLEVSGGEKPDDWLPLNVICENCGKIGTTKVTGWNGKTVTYTCGKDYVKWAEGCDFNGETSPFDGNATLPWKVEWPAKWKVMNVHIEGAGKDHCAAGGSRDIARRISEEVFNYPEPFNIPYEFFNIQGKKMSASKGLGVSAKDVADLLPPKLLKLLMIRKEPNRPIDFDPEGRTIPNLFDEYDRLSDHYFKRKEDPNPIFARVFELCQKNINEPPSDNWQMRFSVLGFIVQMPHLDAITEAEKLKGTALTEAEKEDLRERVFYMKKWLEIYADDSFKYTILDALPENFALNEKQTEAFALLSERLENTNEWAGEIIHDRIHRTKEAVNIEPKEMFQPLYQMFLGRNDGPQVGWFLSTFSQEQVLNRINSALHQKRSLPKVNSEHLLPNDHGHHLLEHADYGHLLPAAHGLLEKHVNQTKAHLLATGATMATLAKKFGGNEDTWRVAGMLHDLDWDSLDKDADRHCGEELQAMLSEIEAPNELLGDIRAHYAHMYGAEYPLDTMLRKALYCCDELTGFIIAVALVRPSKKLEDVKVKSVTKKLKDKGFAAQVDREQIYACKELLGLEINEMVELTLEAMKPIAEELGL